MDLLPVITCFIGVAIGWLSHCVHVDEHEQMKAKLIGKAEGARLKQAFKQGYIEGGRAELMNREREL